MLFAPELQVLVFIGVAFFVAYAGIYPTLNPLTVQRLMLADLGVSALILSATGALFFGRGIEFSLFLFSVPWWAYTLILMMAIEWPIFRWFCAQHGLDPFDDGGED